MLDDTLLKRFIKSFFGYGNYNSDFWFIGMEEGGGNSKGEIQKRLDIWQRRGCVELEDVKEYHIELGMGYLFAKKPKLQPTWSKIIRVLLGIEGRTHSIENVREYQQDALGRRGGDTCLVELLPLPSPGVGKWLYSSISQLPFLKDRETYKDAVTEQRIRHIGKRISQYAPKCVVFYGFSYEPDWSTVADGMTFHPHDELVCKTAANGNTLFAIVKHPTAFGVTNDYFYDIGRFMREKTISL